MQFSKSTQGTLEPSCIGSKKSLPSSKQNIRDLTLSSCKEIGQSIPMDGVRIRRVNRN